MTKFNLCHSNLVRFTMLEYNDSLTQFIHDFNRACEQEFELDATSLIHGLTYKEIDDFIQHRSQSLKTKILNRNENVIVGEVVILRTHE